MAGASTKKRSHADSAAAAAGKLQRPKKKQKKVSQYHSDSEDDLDFDNAIVDDVASLSGSDAESDSDAGFPTKRRTGKKPIPTRKNSKKSARTDQGDDDSDDQENDAGTSSEDDDDDDEEEVGDGFPDPESGKRPKSKRNDPDAFATSLHKILSTKLSKSKKSDAILSRSVEAQKASREIIDATLEAKARKLLRDQKLLALEKGRVKDVLTGDNDAEGEGAMTSTGEIMQTERRLRKTAHRGVVMLFRAVREAQERAVEADRDARKDGVVSTLQRKEKVNEMSRQGFLDLIAGGGGGGGGGKGKGKRSALVEEEA
ncbi:Rrp15p-domain-containing protein [Nemania sp. FL0916]|nr:Rrp15p-domain-containing protein [Nemania sp. FL0916]